MSCTAKQLNLCRLIQNSYKSLLLNFGETDISNDTVTLLIYPGFARNIIEEIEGQIFENSFFFPEFTLAKNEYKYEIIWTHNEKELLIITGKYTVTDKACGCGDDNDTINITVNNGDTVINIALTETILNTNEGPGGDVSWNEVTGKPISFPPSAHTHTWSDITGKPTFFSGNYSDLTGKPVLFSGSYNDLTDKPSLFSGNYTDLSNKPTIPAAQVNSDWNSISGYSQILNKPSLFSGSYTDLTNKPTIPNAQVNSDWSSASGVSQILNKPSLFSGVYSDLTGKPTLFSGAYADLTGKPTLFDGTWSSLTGKPSTFAPSAHTHVWADITDKPSTFTPPVASSTVLGGVKIWTGTQTAYDAISTKATDVLYFIEKT